MAEIDVEELLADIDDLCGDSEHSKEECADAYEEVQSHAAIAARALREEIGKG